MTIVYNTYKFPGRFNKLVTVATDIDGGANFEIELNGYVDPIPMGVLKVDNRKILIEYAIALDTRTIEIPIRNTGDADLVITKVISKKRGTLYYDQKKDGPFIIKADKTRALSLSITLPEKGRYMDSVMIHSDARNVTAKGYKLILKADVK